MNETTMERPVADLATLQKQLEELVARKRSNDRTSGERPKVQEPGWGK